MAPSRCSTLDAASAKWFGGRFASLGACREPDVDIVEAFNSREGRAVYEAVRDEAVTKRQLSSHEHLAARVAEHGDARGSMQCGGIIAGARRCAWAAFGHALAAISTEEGAPEPSFACDA